MAKASATTAKTRKPVRLVQSDQPVHPAGPDFDAVDGEMIQALPGQLVGSDYNVRNNDQSCVKGLAASIVAKGVLQNLVVVDDLGADGQPTGKLGTAAGGRRRRALYLAVSDGRWPADRPVWVKRISHAAARLASLGENSEREPMHPLDEFVAFRDLRAEGRPVEDIAAAFGVEPDVVTRRLKLANVAPSLLDAYRAGDMTLDVLMAFTIKDDHAAQKRVWKSLPAWSKRNPSEVRKALTEGKPSIDDPHVRYVGLTAYKSAGGEVLEDMFGKKDDCYILNTELLGQLAIDRLNAVASKVMGEGWGWVESRLRFTHSDRAEFGTVQGLTRSPTADETARLQKLSARLEKADAAMAVLSEAECWSDEEISRVEQLSDEGQGIAAERDALLEAMCGLSLETMQAAGAVVVVDQNGRAEVVRGLVRAEDKKRLRAAQRAADQKAAQEAGLPDSKVSESADGVKHSESLVQRLTANRTVALQHLLARNHHVALAALAHSMVERLLGGVRSYSKTSALCVDASDCEHQLTTVDPQIQESPTWVALAEHVAAWRERIEGVESDLLPWLIALAPAELFELLALCAALTVNGIARREGAHESDGLALALGLDMADHWQPTAASYLSLVPKTQILTAVTEAVSADEATKLDKLKKPEMVQAAEALLNGRRWLPGLLQQKAAA